MTAATATAATRAATARVTTKVFAWFLRGVGIVAAFWLLVPDAVFALLFGFTEVGVLRAGSGGGLDVVYPDAARAFGVGRVLFFAAAVACCLGMERRRGFFVEDVGRMPALYGFAKQAAGGLCVAGIFGYTLGMMLHFFEEWSVAALVFAVLLGGVLSFYVVGALGSEEGAEGAEDAAALVGDAMEVGGGS